MGKKGYVFSLIVFLLFVSTFVVVITNLKSVSIIQDSNYDKTTIEKGSSMCKNIEYLLASGMDCTALNAKINNAKLPFTVLLDCSNPMKPHFLLDSASNKYLCGHTGSFKYCGDGTVDTPNDFGFNEICDSSNDAACPDLCRLNCTCG